MFNKRKDVVVMDRQLTRLESPPEDTRLKNKKKLNNMRLFFTADNHYYHKNLSIHRDFNSVEEMNELMIDNHNKKITKNDNIYILGDFSFGTVEQTLEILNRLNGNKFLIIGNHDEKMLKSKEVVSKFCWVKDYYKLRYNGLKIILSHYPFYKWDCSHYGSLMFHGHIHEQKLDVEIKNLYNVGVDVNCFEPVSLEDILGKIDYKILK